MNTYDPADGIVYVHMARETAPCPTLLGEDRGCARLPAGYANGSPSTALRQPRSQLRKPPLMSASRPSIPIQGKPGETSLRRSRERRPDTTGRVDTA
jgi:hypothetical protein